MPQALVIHGANDLRIEETEAEPLGEHQLRVHMMSLGLPIEGDQIYPQVLRGPHEAEDFNQPLQLLAHSVQFTDPHTGQARVFQSQLELRL